MHLRHGVKMTPGGGSGGIGDLAALVSACKKHINGK